MLIFRGSKSGRWTLLVLQLLCVLLYPTNGHPSPSLDVDEDLSDEDQETHEDEIQDEDWDDNDEDEEEKENTKFGSTEEDSDPCNQKYTNLELKCLDNMKCCISSQCAAQFNKDKCFDIFTKAKELLDKEKSKDT